MATRVDGPQDAVGGDGEDPGDVEDVLQLGHVEDLGVDGIATHNGRWQQFSQFKD